MVSAQWLLQVRLEGGGVRRAAVLALAPALPKPGKGAALGGDGRAVSRQRSAPFLGLGLSISKMEWPEEAIFKGVLLRLLFLVCLLVYQTLC